MTEAMNVLLVDDKTENLLALESLLKKPSVVFHRAVSGVRALELLLLHDFALAVVDVQMPEMDGFELAELMRGIEQTRSVPIIFVTAGAVDRINTFKGYEKGAVDFLYKPLEPHIVKSKVEIFLELARQRQLLRSQLQQTQVALHERNEALGAAQDALATRDEFMSIASHELKTPVTSLHLQLQMMRRILPKMVLTNIPDRTGALAADRFARGLEVCERQSRRLVALLDELLDLTRVRLGKLNLVKEEVSLAEITQEAVGRLENQAEQSGSQLEVRIEKDLRGVWDASRIEQVITNLVSNAIKYGEGKPITIVIGASQDGRTASFSIEDQGGGIPEHMQEKIFQRFERAERTEKISGLGLGLYISRQIVEAHGGKIYMTSTLQRGSTFFVDLPLSYEPPDRLLSDH